MTVETLTFTGPELDALLAKRRLHDIEEANRRANASWTLMCEKMVAAERRLWTEAKYTIGIDTSDGHHTVVVYRMVLGQPTTMVAKQRLPKVKP